MGGGGGVDWCWAVLLLFIKVTPLVITITGMIYTILLQISKYCENVLDDGW